jgi:hypothetical protein
LDVPAFCENPVTLSIGGHMEQGNSVFESVISGSVWKSRLRSNIRTTLMSGDVFINSGVNVMGDGEPMAYFPFVGLGFGFNAMQRGIDKMTISDLATNPQQSVFLWQGALLVNGGVGTDLFFIDPNKKGNLVLGIRAGYCYDVYTMERWYTRGTKISDLPSPRHCGAYIRLVIGASGNAAHP